MISYHGKQEDPSGARDRMCLLAIRRGYIKVDAEAGRAWSARFHGKEIGSINKLGYKVFTLHLDGKRAQIKLHRLIWISANGLIPPGMVIDHINRTKHDNRISNLRLADAKTNSNNRRDYSGKNNPAARLDLETVERIRKDYKDCKNIMRLSKRYGVSHSQTSNIVHGRSWV